jgi:hypothetical protein
MMHKPYVELNNLVIYSPQGRILLRFAILQLPKEGIPARSVEFPSAGIDRR